MNLPNFVAMDRKNIKLVATDLDGTFLKNDRSISAGNLEALQKLGEKGVIRVAATGRNLKKVEEVIAPDVPFDYIVFSSGAGVYQWSDKKHLFNLNITPASTKRLVRHFIQQEYNFYAFAPAPQNHNLWFRRGKEECPEFNKYLSFHNAQAKAFQQNGELDEGLCQFLLIIPEDENNFEALKQEVEAQCSEIRVIRSSSPVTEGYIWLEVFHKDVSKGHGVNHICNILGIQPEQTCGIGNDYNDLDLLNFTAHSFLTENAPANIKNRFIIIPSNEKDAFAHAVQPLFK